MSRGVFGAIATRGPPNENAPSCHDFFRVSGARRSQLGVCRVRFRRRPPGPSRRLDGRLPASVSRKAWPERRTGTTTVDGAALDTVGAALVQARPRRALTLDQRARRGRPYREGLWPELSSSCKGKAPLRSIEPFTNESKHTTICLTQVVEQSDWPSVSFHRSWANNRAPKRPAVGFTNASIGRSKGSRLGDATHPFQYVITLDAPR